jgi:hypothetical protein
MIHPNLDWDSHDAILIQIWMLVTTCPDPEWDEFQIGMTTPIPIGMHSKLGCNMYMVRSVGRIAASRHTALFFLFWHLAVLQASRYTGTYGFVLATLLSGIYSPLASTIYHWVVLCASQMTVHQSSWLDDQQQAGGDLPDNEMISL